MFQCLAIMILDCGVKSAWSGVFFVFLAAAWVRRARLGVAFVLIVARHAPCSGIASGP